MSLSPGTKLGPYEILAPLGAGGMGEVYRATAAGEEVLSGADSSPAIGPPVGAQGLARGRIFRRLTYRRGTISSARYTAASGRPKSKMEMMPGWFSAAAALASRSKRAGNRDRPTGAVGGP